MLYNNLSPLVEDIVAEAGSKSGINAHFDKELINLYSHCMFILYWHEISKVFAIQTNRSTAKIYI